LSAGVAHELNNPLSGILTFAEDLLLETAPDDPKRADYEVILNETMRCRKIVRELLEFSRQKTPKRERMQVNSVVKRVLQMVERQASFHNIVFLTELDEHLPDASIDPHQIQQAILNLVINARDAMKACGEIGIRSEIAENGHSIALTVSDTGCGIPESQLGEIFEPFFSTKAEQGHGLGLAAVLSVVERHGGRVEVDSKVGEGSTFRLVLPSAVD
jgi:two-component system NtrC family sensor kinase